MRIFRIRINGKSFTVSVDQSQENRFRATVGDDVFEAEATSKGEITTWLLHGPTENIHAQTRNLPTDRIDVWLNSLPFAATVQTIGIGGYALAPEATKGGVSGEVRALMPGRVTSILVKMDEAVKEGAPLLILEAMKMQNEIISPRKGKVRTIRVQEGETVKKDTVLMTIE